MMKKLSAIVGDAMGVWPPPDYIRTSKQWSLHYFFRKDTIMAKGNNSQGKDKKKKKAKATVKAGGKKK